MRFSRFMLASAVMGLAACSASAATNLLTNGSFETGDLSGWTLGGVTGDGTPETVIGYNNQNTYPLGAFGEAIPADNYALSGSPDAAGSHALYFASDYALEGISQTVDLQAGVTYDFGFDYYLPLNGASNPNDATFALSLNNIQLASYTASQQPATQWLNYNSSTSFSVNTSGTFTFTFAATTLPVDRAKDFVVDRVYLTAESAVPEPASWAMMVGGFGIVGGALRRKRATTLVQFG